jgi:aspartate aminotransferase-like enzyme
MEAGIRNAPAGRVLALVNGAFSERFAHVAESCGRAVDRYEVAWGEAHGATEVEARVRARSYAVVTVVHSETSTGVLNDVQAISRAAQAGGAVCLIDSVTGIRGAPLHFDAWHLDYVFTGSQKALALPPGLAFAVASARFRELGERVNLGTYFDLAEFADAAVRDEAPNTPALSLYYALACQLDHILAEGMPGAWARHAEMSALVAAWATTLNDVAGGRATVLAAPGHRSPTVSTIVLPVGSNGPTCVRAVAERGYTIGEGYGRLKATTIRIGHMGDHTVTGLAGCLRALRDVLETGA